MPQDFQEQTPLPYPRIEPTGQTIGGRTVFRLVEDFHFFVNLGFGQYDLYMPAGTETDFGSVPWFLWPILNPLNPRLMVGWLAHDTLYKHRIGSRFFADALARFVHWTYGATVFERMAAYVGVRVFGWKAWRQYRRESESAQLDAQAP